MDSDTRPSGAADAGPSPFCHQHGGAADTALPVRSVARNSGPDVLLYACAPCRDEHGLTPLRGMVV